MHNFSLIRSKRKTIAIHILPSAKVEVRAPEKMPKSDIDKFVASKEGWIETKLSVMRDREGKKSAFSLDYGSLVSILGKEYPITAKPGNMVSFDMESLFLPPNLSSDQIKEALVILYKKISKQILSEKAAYFAEKMGLAPSAVKINSAKTRWGSCSSRNSINFSWRLIMAEEDIIDYVVVHELAHITEMNHSKNFLLIVEGVFPDFKKRQTRLKHLQQRLGAENWD